MFFYEIITLGNSILETKFPFSLVVLRFYSPLSVISVGFHSRETVIRQPMDCGLRPDHRAGASRVPVGRSHVPQACATGAILGVGRCGRKVSNGAGRASGATFLLWICLPCCLREGSSGSRRSASAGQPREKHMKSVCFAFVFCEMVGLDYQEFPARSTPTQTCSPGRPCWWATELTWASGSSPTPCSRQTATQTSCTKEVGL